MKLLLGEDYPAGPPKGFFTTRIFHPNGEPRSDSGMLLRSLFLVSSSGQICVNTLKKDWTPEVSQRLSLLILLLIPVVSLRPPSSTSSRSSAVC